MARSSPERPGPRASQPAKESTSRQRSQPDPAPPRPRPVRRPHHRPAGECEHLPRHALGEAQHLVGHGLRVHAATVPPSVNAAAAVIVGRGAVERVALGAAPPPGTAATRPAARRRPRRRAARHVDDDVAGAVEAAGAVALDLARRPAGPVPGLPHQRRRGRVDADALHVARRTAARSRTTARRRPGRAAARRRTPAARRSRRTPSTRLRSSSRGPAVAAGAAGSSRAQAARRHQQVGRGREDHRVVLRRCAAWPPRCRPAARRPPPAARRARR